VGLLLLLSELTLRILLPQIGWRNFEDPFLGWSSREYRLFEPSADRGSSQRTRFLFLGDSNLAGGGIRNLHQRFPIIFGEKLRDEAEVQVFASGGWGTDQQLLAFLEKGKAWEPDVVVVVFTPYNDLANIVSNGKRWWMSKPYFVIDDVTGELRLFTADGIPLTSTSSDPSRHRPFDSYLIDFVHYQAVNVLRRLTPEQQAVRDTSRVDERYLQFSRFSVPREQSLAKLSELRRLKRDLSWSPQAGINVVSAYIHENFELNAYQWRVLEGILAYLKREVTAINARLILMLLPIPFDPAEPRTMTGGDFEYSFMTPHGEFTFRAAEPRDRLAAICARFGIEFFDPTSEFIEIVTTRGLERAILPDPEDTHLSPVAHQIFADQFRRYLAGETR
jgi:lysophospholipase L1-like esterase